MMILLLVGGVAVAARGPAAGSAALYATADPRPQWGDMGMDHLLCSAGQSSIAPPTAARTSPSGSALMLHRYTPDRQRLYNGLRVGCVVVPHRERMGYLYLIQCLRL